MDRDGIDAIHITSETGEIVGLLHRRHIWQALFRESHTVVEEMERLQSKLDKRTSWLKQFFQAVQALLTHWGHTIPEESLLRSGLEALRQLLEARYAAIGILDDAGRLQQFFPSGMTAAEQARIGELPIGKGLLGVVVKENQAIRLDDLKRDPRFSGFPSHHPDMKSLLAVPIAHQGVVHGRVYLCDRIDGTPFGEADEALAAGFAQSLGLVLSRVRELEEQQRLKEYLARAQRLESLGRLAGGIAHEFNNLMTVALGFSEYALEMDGSLPAMREALQQIRTVSQRAACLTQQLLTFTRGYKGAPVRLNPNQCVEKLSRMLKRVLGEHIEQHTDLDPELPAINADPGQVEQILMNLVINARDAMPEGGQLTIRTATVSPDRVRGLPHRETTDHPWVLLEVEDTGCGMDSQTLQHIFEPFFTTKDVGKGTGLGLAAVMGIIQQSGACIDVASQPGEGTVFRIYWPTQRGSDRQTVLSGGAPQVVAVHAFEV